MVAQTRFTSGKATRAVWAARRRALYLKCKTLSDGERAKIEADHAVYLARKVAQPVALDKDAVLPWTPVGISSVNWPVAEKVIGEHIDGLGKKLQGRTGIQHIAQRLPDMRERDCASVTKPVVENWMVERFAEPMDQIAAVRRKRKTDATCYELHPGLCRRRDAVHLQAALTVHRSLQEPMVRASNKHESEGSAFVAFVARNEGEEPPPGIQSLRGKSVHFYILNTLHLLRKRGVLSRCEPVLRVPAHDALMPFPLQVAYTEAGLIEQVSSHELSLRLACDPVHPGSVWWAHQLDYSDETLEVVVVFPYYGKVVRQSNSFS